MLEDETLRVELNLSMLLLNMEANMDLFDLDLNQQFQGEAEELISAEHQLLKCPGEKSAN